MSAVLSGFLSSGGCTVASNGCAEDSARYTIAIAMLVIPSEVEEWSGWESRDIDGKTGG